MFFRTTFGNFLKFSLANHFPIITTKKVYWKGVVEELLWFLRADTNALHLGNKKVNIWISNTTSEFLKSRKLYFYMTLSLYPWVYIKCCII